MDLPGLVNTSVILAAASIVAAWGINLLLKKRKDRHLPRLDDIEIPKKWRPVGKLGTLIVYPLKSGRRWIVDTATCSQLGLKLVPEEGKIALKDRSFMLFDIKNDRMFTMGEKPELLNVETHPVDIQSVKFTHPSAPTDLVVMVPTSSDSKIVTVQLKNISALDCGEEAAKWFSQVLLNKDDGLRLLYHDRLDSFQPKWNAFVDYYRKMRTEHVGTFTNQASFMLLGQSSVTDLNTRLNNPVVCGNFRPNFVVEGTAPYAEDKWEWVKIGEIVFRALKSTARCTKISINPETGKRNPEIEPYRTLKKYRLLPTEQAKKLEGEAPMMGLYLGLHKGGDINVGDTVYINDD